MIRKYVYAQIVNKKVETKFIYNSDQNNNEITFNDTGAKKIQDLFDKLSIKKRIATSDTRVENLIKNVDKNIKEICEENNFKKPNFDIDSDGNSLLGLCS